MYLIFNCNTDKDYKTFVSEIGSSDFSIQYSDMNRLYFEVSDEGDANDLELELDNIINENNISGYFELEA